MNDLSLILAGILAGAFGAMGLGGGSVLMLYLTVICGEEQLKAQGINLMFFLPIALLAVIIFTVKKQIPFKKLIPIIIGGVFGVVAGWYLSGIIGSHNISKIFGVLLLGLGIHEIVHKY